ncbi:MAG: pitrilysin family protein [Firmicutes bacterium]|nr:pitrilysin family protein [Bacillota bacterium]
MTANWHSEQYDGIHVHILPTEKYKMVTALATWQCTLAEDTVTAYSVLPHVLLRGTKRHPSPEGLMRAFDDLYGASIGGRAVKQGDAQTIEFSLQCANESHLPEAKGLFAEAFSLFAEVLFQPHLLEGAFDPKAVQTEKMLHKQRIENVVNDKIAYAADRCTQLMCENLPYGIPRNGYAQRVDEITPASLYEDYRHLVQTHDLHLYIVGNVDAHVLSTSVMQVLKDFRSETFAKSVADMRTVPFNRVNRAEPKVIVERLDVNQGKLNMGLSTNASYASEDYPALLVYNGVLGGFPHSKLFTNVREKASLAYYASSRLEGLKGIIFIQSGIQIENFDQAQGIIVEQLEALRSGMISDDELQFTRDGLINQYLLSDDQPLTGAMLQMYGRLSGRSRTVPELLDSIASVTKEDVVRVAQGVKLDTVYFLRDQEGETHA